jgi:hypothetical protein
MRESTKARFHQLFGKRKPRINFAKGDFGDYVLMIGVCGAVMAGAFGRTWLTAYGLALCLFMIVSFAIRHGVAFNLPLLLRRPQDVLFIFAHKVQNLPAVYWAALGLALLENAAIHVTPGWPHHTALMRQIGYGLFYLHLGGLFVYRTISFVHHWRKHALVSEVLLQSPWKNAGMVKRNMRYEIVHAYLTGLLTHLVLVVPWYLAITHLQFSVLFAPVVCVANLVMKVKFLKVINAWFYRDHWLGHNSELEFVYLHGSHHDAIPVGLIGVAGNGFLEGLLRNMLGYPTPFYNPLIACLSYSMEVKTDIDFHQFVPGIFPELPLELRRISQHSTHHYGHLEPYGFAIKLDQPGVSPGLVKAFERFPDSFNNSAQLEETLTGFEWDNARHQWFLKICEKHQ